MKTATATPFDLFGDAHLQADLPLQASNPQKAQSVPSFDDFETLYIEPKRSVAQGIAPGIYYDLSNRDYHRDPAISNSSLGYIDENPSQLVWSRNAPRDPEKESAFDFGTAVHTLLLEPDLFDAQFVVGPDHARRSNDEKAAWAAFEEANRDKIILTADERRKLAIMHESVYAHPVAKMIFDAKGYNEASIFWQDKETGEMCRIRPDRVIDIDGKPVIVDVKKVEGLERFEKHVEEFGYYVQDAMYCDGYEQHFGVKPEFWFLCVSSTVSAAKYEVEVVRLPSEWREAGYAKYRANLEKYHYCRINNLWHHIRTLERPRWAK